MSLDDNYPLGREYQEHMLGYWAFVGRRTLEAWYSLGRIGAYNRAPDFSSLYANVIGYWTEMAAASIVAMRGVEKRPALIVFSLDVGEAHAECQPLAIFSQALPRATPKVHWLGPIVRPAKSDRGAVLTADDLDVTVSRDGSSLRFEILSGRTHEKRKEAAQAKAKEAGVAPSQESQSRVHLAKAVYRALVTIGDVPVAEILIDVNDGEHQAASVESAAEAPDPGRARKAPKARKVQKAAKQRGSARKADRSRY